MPPYHPVQYLEQFHLLFLAQLGRRLDKRTFVLKGGCNLRFFLGSVRYSEDMDLDVAGPAVEVVLERVRAFLKSQPFAAILRARGIELEHVTEHKQTETTQRWKFGLRVPATAVTLPTRIEFSRRGLDEGVQFESVDAAIARAYALPPLFVSHYGAQTAAHQKVGALAHRREPQARDVFDLHHLIASGAAKESLREVDAATGRKAAANAMSMNFGTFKSQVLAYLPAEDLATYDSPEVWETMVLEVVEALDRPAS